MKGECRDKRKTKFSGLAMPNRSLFHEKMRIISGIAEILHRRAGSDCGGHPLHDLPYRLHR